MELEKKLPFKNTETVAPKIFHFIWVGGFVQLSV